MASEKAFMLVDDRLRRLHGRTGLGQRQALRQALGFHENDPCCSGRKWRCA
jgi:hypothetical protein